MRIPAAIIALAVGLASLSEAAHADRVDDLIADLSASGPRTRLHALMYLADIGDPRAIAPCAAVLLQDRNPKVRGGAAGALTTGLAGFSPEGNGLPEPKSSRRVHPRRVNIAWVENARVPLKINASHP